MRRGPTRFDACDKVCNEPRMTGLHRPLPRDGMIATDSLRLVVTDAPWPLAVENAADIAAHFARRQAANPSFFDGQVFVLRQIWQQGTGIEGVASLERFSSFLYWRDGRAGDAQALDGFGTALVRSAEGHVLAVRASAGTLNAGRVYLPGGFIDARDMRGNGTIDIDASIARELAEETGLDARTLQRAPGFIVARRGRYCCFCVEFRSPLGAAELRDEMLSGARRDTDGELADVIVIRDESDLVRHDVIDHARLVIGSALARGGP